jgi:chromate transporter
VLNLAVWFSLHTLFAEVAEQHRLGVRLLVPDWATIDPAAAAIAVGAFVAMFRFKVGMLPTLGGGVLLGAAWFVLAR